MSAKRLVILSSVAVVAIAVVVAIKNTGEPAIAFQGSDCSSYRLPEGADVSQVGQFDKKTILMEYRTPDGKYGQLTVPYDLQPATCVDEQIRGIVSIAHETDQSIKDSTCKFVGDLLAGRVKLPPDKVNHFDLAYAREWYRTSCPGGR